jgi:two-component system chemotaxis response regulator CheY
MSASSHDPVPAAPAGEPQVKRRPAWDDPVPSPPVKRQVLIVDDDAETCALLAKCLSDLGAETQTACTGQHALEALQRMRPDLVLLDYEMPGMHGLKCLETIRKTRPEVRVVMVTASKRPEMVKQACLLGAVGYLVKPFDASEIKKRLALLMEPKAAVAS